MQKLRKQGIILHPLAHQRGNPEKSHHQGQHGPWLRVGPAAESEKKKYQSEQVPTKIQSKHEPTSCSKNTQELSRNLSKMGQDEISSFSFTSSDCFIILMHFLLARHHYLVQQFYPTLLNADCSMED